MKNEINETTSNTQFPVRKQMRLVLDMDLDWNVSLDIELDPSLEAKRQQLINDPIMFDKFLGNIVLHFVYDYFSKTDNKEGLFGFDEEDIIYAANLNSMNSDEVLGILMANKLGFGDNSIADIITINAFSMQVKNISLFDRKRDKKIDMSPIQKPLILESGQDYLIGQGNGEIMLVVSSNLERTNLEKLIKQLDTTINHALIHSKQMGSALTRFGILINTTLEDTENIRDIITAYCLNLAPKAKLDIYINELDRTFRKEDLVRNFR